MTKTAMEMLDRMEALVRRLAAHDEAMGGRAVIPLGMLAEARAIVAELPEPVDADLLTARELAALGQVHSTAAEKYRKGMYDNDTCIKQTVQALRHAREEGVK